MREDAAGRQAAGRPTSCPARRGRSADWPTLRELPRRASCRSTWCRRPSSLLDALPLTPNGKVDRRGAAARRTRRATAADGYVRAARRRSRRLLAAIWAECSGVERVGVGRRLLRPRRPLAAGDRVVSRVAAALRRRAAAARPLRGADRRRAWRGRSTRPLARGRTGCAGAAARRASPRDGRAAALVRPGAAVVPRPARARQRRPTTCRCALRLRGRARRAGAGRALSEMVAPARGAAHDVRRRSTASRCQVVAPGVGLALAAGRSARRCRRRTREARGATAGARRPQRAVRSRARAAAPRACCCGSAQDEHVLVLDDAPHRLRRLVDGRPDARDSRRSTPRSRAASRPPLPELPVQYADFARLAARLARGRGARARSSPTGREQLAGAPPALELPTDRPRPPVQTLPRREPARFALCRRSCARRCSRSARREGATLFMTLLAGVRRRCSHRYSGQDDLVGRHADRRTAAAPRLEGLIGFFVNTLVLRADLVGRSDLPRAAARRCARRRSAPTPTRTCRSSGWSRSCAPSASLEPHAALPGDVRAAERARRRAAHARRPRGRAVRRSSAARPSSTSTLTLTEAPAALVRARSSTAPTCSTAHHRAAARRTCQTLLAAAVADPERPSASCRCSPRGRAPAAPVELERHRAAASRASACVHELFERAGGAHARRGRRSPSASEQLTYAELDAAPPARAPPAPARRRARRAGRRLPRALARRWSSACSASSRPAAPTCRSTRRTRPSGCAHDARGRAARAAC